MTTTTTTQSAAPALPPTGRRLTLALKLDAVVTGLNGVAYLTAAPLLQDVLGLPAPALQGAGVFLTGFAIAVWLIATRSVVSGRAVGVVIAVNLLWVVGSLAVAGLGWGSPAPLGLAWIALQAQLVAAFAAMQWAVLRHRRTT